MNTLKIKLDRHEETAVKITAQTLGIPVSKLKIGDMALVAALAEYNRAHDELNKAGAIAVNRFGEKVESIQSKRMRKASGILHHEMKKRRI